MCLFRFEEYKLYAFDFFQRGERRGMNYATDGPNFAQFLRPIYLYGPTCWATLGNHQTSLELLSRSSSYNHWAKPDEAKRESNLAKSGGGAGIRLSVFP